MNLDTIVCADCSDFMATLNTEDIDIIITSPPYWNQKSYAHWKTYDDYNADVEIWVKHCFRILKPGRHCFWIIPDKLPYPPKENGGDERLYIPIYATTEMAARLAGFIPEFPIIWKKPHGSRKMFGSYPYPPTTIHTPMTERICVWRKPGKPDLNNKSDESKYTKRQWVDWAQDLWEIAPDSSNKHPAPFPVKIPNRILTLWSFVGDLVFDPFIGSGTTAIAAILTGRHYLGCDKHQEYIDMALERINKVQLELWTT